mmetsp:Transcript_25424/g.66556  ORF Transcript_25424/g.66556 Transcript_25424/m.66556 type:complete len:205 (+) Transcript_25424:655-1269(+)
MGSCMKRLTVGRTSLLRVAENIITCFSCGVFMKICCTSARMSSFSSIWSHSSSTKCLRLERSRAPFRASASTRPGVPTTMCGVSSLSWRSCTFESIPPMITIVLTPVKYLENRSYSLLIWKASSRVWHIASTCTSPSTGSSCCSVAITKTAVLPIPDLAWQMISVFTIAGGIVSFCTCDGCSKPQSTMARRISGFKRKSRKPEL